MIYINSGFTPYKNSCRFEPLEYKNEAAFGPCFWVAVLVIFVRLDINLCSMWNILFLVSRTCTTKGPISTRTNITGTKTKTVWFLWHRVNLTWISVGTKPKMCILQGLKSYLSLKVISNKFSPGNYVTGAQLF